VTHPTNAPPCINLRHPESDRVAQTILDLYVELKGGMREPTMEEYLVSALGAAIVRVVPSIVVVALVALFTRNRAVFLLAGMLPTLILPGVAHLVWWRLGTLTGSYLDDPTQQAYDNVAAASARPYHGVVIGMSSRTEALKRSTTKGAKPRTI
jgi:hypothetical protein